MERQRKKKASVHNLGCKVNSYESQAMQQLLEEAGYEIVPFAPGADVYVINTCSVTNIADRKSRQMLHKAKKMNPEAIVVAAGCYAQTDTQKLEGDASVDLILGNNCKQNIVEALADYEKTRKQSSRILPIQKTRDYEELKISSAAEHVRAFIKIQDGCNQFCTYCIIPYARGRVRSRRPEDVLGEIRTLAERGYHEVVLTGIHISSYGTDMRLDPAAELLSLIRKAARIPGIERIRLGSLEPGIITEDFAAEAASVPELCPHFHLSLQSGCDRTLERMGRRYRSAEFADKCRILREHFDRPAVTTDVITGFPGETEEDFAESFRFIESIHFYETHVFPYSRRKGTKAASMDGQLTEAVKKERSDRLLALNRVRQREYRSSFLQSESQILIEEKTDIGGLPFWAGHTREYLKVLIPGTEDCRINDIVRVRLEDIREDLDCNLTGSIIK